MVPAILGNVAATVAAKVVGQMQQHSGEQMTGDVAMALVAGVTGDLATISEGEGFYQYSQEELDAGYQEASKSMSTQMEDYEMFDQPTAQRDVEVLEDLQASGELEGMLEPFEVADAADRQ